MMEGKRPYADLLVEHSPLDEYRLIRHEVDEASPRLRSMVPTL